MIAARELLRGRGKQTRKRGSRVGGFVIEDAEEPATGRIEVRLRCLEIEHLLAAERIVEARRARVTIPDRLQQTGRQLAERDPLIPRMYVVQATSQRLDMVRYPNRTASLISPIHPPPAS